ncbi:MAG: MFS transporter [Anaerolineaceae bacterium]
MFIKQKLNQFGNFYNDYPRTFWTLMGVSFIDHLGGALMFPFFALYITSKFNVGMTEVGVLFALFSISSFIGSALGGALSDRLGRRGMLIFSLISTSASSVLMGLVNSLGAFYVLALLVGIFTDVGGPARQAMMADLLPVEKRVSGFGIFRVVFNISAAIGPAIGGFMATRSYLALFITDAVLSFITAILVYLYIPETKPKELLDAPKESIGATFRGYFTVLKDRIFVFYIFASILAGLVYMNFNTTLGVFLRDYRGIPESGYGLLITINATMVVLMQFSISRVIEKYKPMLMMALGTMLSGLGFALFGFVNTYSLAVFAMVVLTIGEMIWAPVSNALVAMFAPEDKRGRYMAAFGFSWGIPFAIGPLLAGQFLDSGNGNWLWYACGIIGILGTLCFLALNKSIHSTRKGAQTEPVKV